MNFKKIIATVLSSVALFANVALPAFASTTLEITGNGADSNNTTTVSTDQQTVVAQTNTSNIVNDVTADSSTGGNKADKNTGGSVNIDTGDSKTLVTVQNSANSNIADVENCNCGTDAEVVISGNGADSKNKAKLNLGGSTIVAQSNDSYVSNNVDADSSTGDNSAKKNTGGNVEIATGNAVTHVDLSTAVNSNWAKVSGGNHVLGDGVSLKILGNGADSSNAIKLDLGRDILLQQYNDSEINNWVTTEAETGDNKAKSNTGGASSIDTGNAFAGAVVDNAANFNSANVDCDCLTGVTVKVAGNGADTYNHIKANLGDSKNVFQDNSCSSFEWFDWGRGGCVNNHLNSDADTGDNGNKKNTANPGVDPSITTGDSWTSSEVSNSGNANVYGANTPSNGWNGNGNINFSFSLQDLLLALGIH